MRQDDAEPQAGRTPHCQGGKHSGTSSGLQASVDLKCIKMSWVSALGICAAGCRAAALPRQIHAHWAHDRRISHREDRGRRRGGASTLLGQQMGEEVCAARFACCLPRVYLHACKVRGQKGICTVAREAMLAALRQGRTLVVDRYAFSGAAFTAAKRLPGLDLEWCKVSAASLILTCHQAGTCPTCTARWARVSGNITTCALQHSKVG